MDNCYNTSEFWYVKNRPEEVKSNGILIDGISIIFKKVRS